MIGRHGYSPPPAPRHAPTPSAAAAPRAHPPHRLERDLAPRRFPIAAIGPPFAQPAQPATERREGAVGDDRVDDVGELVGDDRRPVAAQLGAGGVLGQHSDAVETHVVVLEGRGVTARCAVVVADYRARGAQGAPARHPGAPRQVGVLEREEERRIEPAELVEHPPAQQRGAAARPEDLDGLGAVGARGLAEPAVEGDPEAVDPDPGRVDHTRRRREPHLRGDSSDVVRAAPRREHVRDAVGLDRGVVVEQQDPIPACAPQAGADGSGEAAVLGQRDQLRGGSAARDQFGRSVAGAVVDEDELGRNLQHAQRALDRLETGDRSAPGGDG